MRYGVRTVGAAVLVAAVALGALAWRDRGAGVATRPVAADQDLAPAARELVALVEQGAGTTYRAKYQVRGMEGAGVGAPWLEVYRNGRGRYRQDASPTEAQRGGQRSYAVDGALVRCVQAETGPWTCAEATGATDRPDQLAGSLRIELRGVAVTELPGQQIAGRDARCFRYTDLAGAATEICVGDDGVPLRLAHADRAIELVSFTPAVSAADFTPPAPVR